MLIYPEITVTPDTPTIKFRLPREQVDLDKELPRILHAQGWALGTYFNVQFITHERDKVLSAALYVVSEESEEKVTSDNPYAPMTKTVFNLKAAQVGPGWVAPMPNGVEIVESSQPQIVWNPGKKVHEVKIDGVVAYESKIKSQAMQYIAEAS